MNWYDEYDSKPSPGMIGRPVREKGLGFAHAGRIRLKIEHEETVACMTATYPTSDALSPWIQGLFLEGNHLLGDMSGISRGSIPRIALVGSIFRWRARMLDHRIWAISRRRSFMGQNFCSVNLDTRLPWK